MYVESYKKLVVWQKAMTLVSEVYIFTKQLPEDERFNLISQMRRCAISGSIRISSLAIDDAIDSIVRITQSPN